MPLARDEAMERRARIHRLIEELEASRNAATTQLLQTQRRLNDIDAQIKQLRAQLPQAPKGDAKERHDERGDRV